MTENEAYRNPIGEYSFEWEYITVCLITLKNRHFVYLLLDGDIPNYIGRTSNLYQRLITHKNHKQFNKIYLCEYKTKYQSIQAEKNLIRYYSPKLNVMHNKNYNK